MMVLLVSFYLKMLQIVSHYYAVKRESAADDAYIQFATQATGGGSDGKL